MKRKILKVNPFDSSQRLDKFLATKLDISRSAAKKFIAGNFPAKVDGRIRSAHYCVESGATVEVFFPDKVKRKNVEVAASQVRYETIYRDSEIAVINKPPGLVVHPAPSVRQATLLAALETEYDTPRLVHRLDKDTSGVIVAALNDTVAAALQKQFKDRNVSKIYNAVAEGSIREDYGEISVPVKRAARDRTKMKVGWVRARKSVTRFKVIERFESAVFVEAYPLTGRTHQIRVHLAYYGHPILGDSKYASSGTSAPRQLLHARSIAFTHPGTKEKVQFSAPLPDDFTYMLKNLRIAKKK